MKKKIFILGVFFIALTFYSCKKENVESTILEQKLNIVLNTLKEVEKNYHAYRVLRYDMQTLCPPNAMEQQSKIIAFLDNKAFELKKSPEFIEASEYLYEHKEELGEFDKVLAESLHREYARTKNITPEMSQEFSLTYNKAFIDWTNARKKSDFSIFTPSLKAVLETDLKKIELTENAKPIPYDNLLDIYERGMTTEMLDQAFESCKERLIPLLKKIKESKKQIRTDFLNRLVTDEQQKQLAQYLLEILKFDFDRGAFTTSEHPFTDGLAKDDIRLTTHYYPNMFYFTLYSIIHECGHALFEQNQPAETWEHFIYNEKTLGQHESVSRFYENIIGRSKEFIHLIYPKLKEIFPQVLSDVTEQELYEAMNIVEPSLIRTGADEFTYTFHIIIRYEIEKALINNGASIDDLPKLWNEKYSEYLGITPDSDSNGILQDIHWTLGLGHFISYSVGNFYNSMYYNTLKEQFDLSDLILKGDFDTINNWMKENVWSKACQLDTATWIKSITGRELTPNDFLDYIETKYSEIYGL